MAFSGPHTKLGSELRLETVSFPISFLNKCLMRLTFLSIYLGVVTVLVTSEWGFTVWQ